MKTFSAGIFLFILCELSFIGSWGASLTRTQYLMGTLCEIQAESPDAGRLRGAISRAFNEISRLEDVLSTYKTKSEVTALNQGAGGSPVPVSEELWEILELSLQASQDSGGAFDVTVGPLREFWKSRNGAPRAKPGEPINDPASPSATPWSFASERGDITPKPPLAFLPRYNPGSPAEANEFPSSEALSSQLKSVGYQKIQLTSTVKSVHFLSVGMAVDFGGIGKGYALDKAAVVLRKNGVPAARLNFGGQILVYGEPEQGKHWDVLLADPLEPEKILQSIPLRSGSISTSSQLEQFHTVGGSRIGHIIDPRTGQPVAFEGSVTVVAPTAAEADALSTALLVMGPEEGLKFINEKKPKSAALYLIPGKNGWIIKKSSRFN